MNSLGENRSSTCLCSDHSLLKQSTISTKVFTREKKGKINKRNKMEECKLLISKYNENCRNLFLNMRRRFNDDALQDSASDLEKM